MNPKPFFYLLIACALPSVACGLFQPGFTATQTAVAETTVAASWTATPTLTPTLTPTETETPTPTPDPCTAENLPAAVYEINDLQMQFDDLSGEAANAQREELPEEITKLQNLLQTAEEQKTPPCLQLLKDHQLKHMNLVIDTLNAFLKGKDRDTVDNMIQLARDEHDEYTLELARLLDIEISTITPTP